jgi:hypothetical protein
LDGLLGIIQQEFPIDVNSTTLIEAGRLRPDTKLYRVEASGSPLITTSAYIGTLYILDTLPGMRIACHPHIVGDVLRDLCLVAAQEFVRASELLGFLEYDSLAVLNILRGGSCYMVAEVLPEGVPVFNVRTEYSQGSYRDHPDDPRSIDVTYSNHESSNARLRDVSTLVVPDTYATGRSAEAALEHLFSEGLDPESIVLYGFMAIPALVRIGRHCSEKGIELASFSICDISQLADNNYDMPLYGLDESLASTGELRRLGSIVDVETLRRFIPSYVAGLDQPGDWSERHDALFNGVGIEMGDIEGHLRKSFHLIESLREINSTQTWYDEEQDEIAKKELDNLRVTLSTIR